MKRFLISMAAMLFLAPIAAGACGYEDESEHYYMFSYCDNSFRDNYYSAMDTFWMSYCKTEYRPGTEELIEVATKKHDVPMQQYLKCIRKYEDATEYMGNTWEYPTPEQLAESKAALRNIVSTATRNLGGKYGNRWALLLMRANMCLDAHKANITFFTQSASRYPDDCYKDMMRNIYARALILTGSKQQAWNIYAEQNDQQSLLWSVRKFTNLAGIRALCAEDPNAPVLNYLVQTYVNRIQSLVQESKMKGNDEEADIAPYLDFRNVIWGRAYAQVSANQKKEFTDFVAFARQMAVGGRSNVPCMWMSAASLVSYYLEDYRESKACIDAAMGMKGTEAMLSNARRIRMLVEPMVADISSESFKTFMAGELRWLDSQVKGTDDSPEAEARERIIRHGLAEQYNRRGDAALHLALCAVTDFNDYDRYSEYHEGRFDYSSNSFCMMNRMTSDEIVQFFAQLDNPSDPLGQYLAGRLSSRYDANFRNDLIGTKLIAENRLEEALPYLRKVDMDYLAGQAISYYSCHRDFRKPFWECYQSISADMYNDNGNLIRYAPRSNVKVDFCNEVIALLGKYATASAEVRKAMAYQLATLYYQASYKGQCWYITHYGQSIMDEQNPREANFPDIARSYLAEAASSADSDIRMSALFAQVGIAPDQWITYDYDDNYNLVSQIQFGSEQYARLKALDDYTKKVGSEKEIISRCDVIKTFRRVSR